MDGKVVIITGGGGGVGTATAKLLLQNGCKVCLIDNDVDSIQKVCADLSKTYGPKNVISSECDVASQKSITDAMDFCEQSLGEISILINTHGIVHEGNFELVIDVNLLGTMRTTFSAIERMRKDNGGKGGQILNIASISGMAAEGPPVSYGTSKAGVIHFSRCIGHQFHENRTGVSVMCLSPSFLTTRMKSRHDESKSAEIMHYKGAAEEIQRLRQYVPIYVSAAQVAEEIYEMLQENKTGCVKVISGKGRQYIDAQLTIHDV